jgi:hypothetical protein
MSPSVCLSVTRYVILSLTFSLSVCTSTCLYLLFLSLFLFLFVISLYVCVFLFLSFFPLPLFIFNQLSHSYISLCPSVCLWQQLHNLSHFACVSGSYHIPIFLRQPPFLFHSLSLSLSVTHTSARSLSLIQNKTTTLFSLSLSLTHTHTPATIIVKEIRKRLKICSRIKLSKHATFRSRTKLFSHRVDSLRHLVYMLLNFFYSLLTKRANKLTC